MVHSLPLRYATNGAHRGRCISRVRGARKIAWPSCSHELRQNLDSNALPQWRQGIRSRSGMIDYAGTQVPSALSNL
jgi:hypothetical protein